MGAKTEKLYGLADKAWQPIVGCREDLECAKRCWARRTVARIVECQRKDHPERAAFFQQVLTPNGQHWNGKVFLDKAHLTDPLRWRKPALIATGFHGDWALLPEADKDRMVAVMALCEQHRFMVLTKRPEYISEWAWRKHGYFTLEYKPGCSVSRFLPLDNVLLGVSITCQADADVHRPVMAALAAMGWQTHVWHEPAVDPVDWWGWEFLKLLVSGGESGPGARPTHPDWVRADRDWCVAHRIPFVFKQWGEWKPVEDAGITVYAQDVQTFGDQDYIRVGKHAAGRLLDGREWSEFPEVTDAPAN